jgi:anti-sigma-K factor RskA
MSDTLPPIDEPGGDRALAMDVALGALGREELAAARRRMLSDPAFRAEVEAWERQLGPLGEAVTPVAPPAALWERIEAEIAPAAATAKAPSMLAQLWNSLGFWRGMAIGVTAAASIILVQLAHPVAPAVAPPGRILVATLAGDDGKALISAAYDPSRAAVVLAPAAHPDMAGKSPELWVIDGGKPRSLGVVDMDAPTTHGVDSNRFAGLKPGAVLAISIEPQGGSPTGQPTGPVVATGVLAAV